MSTDRIKIQNWLISFVSGLVFVLVYPFSNSVFAQNSYSLLQLSGDEKLAAGETEQASDIYNAARTKLQAAGLQDYSEGEFVKWDVLFQSRLAFIDLLDDHMESAGERYRRAFLDISANQDVINHNAKPGRSESLTSRPFSYSQLLKDKNAMVSSAGQNGSQRRIIVIPDSGFLQLIGRVRAGSTFCTGSFVAIGIVLTNAHCIFDGGIDYQEGPPKLKDLPRKFIQEWLYSTNEYESLVYYTHTGREGSWDGQASNDWVLLQLNSEVFVSEQNQFFTSLPQLSEATVQQIKTDKKVWVAGYSTDIHDGEFMSVQTGCDVDWKNYNSALVGHNCIVAQGHSGAPVLFLNSQKQPTIVGLNVSRTLNEKLFSGVMIPSSAWEYALNELL